MIGLAADLLPTYQPKVVKVNKLQYLVQQPNMRGAPKEICLMEPYLQHPVVEDQSEEKLPVMAYSCNLTVAKNLAFGCME